MRAVGDVAIAVKIPSTTDVVRFDEGFQPVIPSLKLLFGTIFELSFSKILKY